VDILVSACLLGHSCRYDGGSKRCEAVCSLADVGHTLIPLCPEVEGGLTVPHAPCELRKTPDGVRAISIDGIDCTAQYEAGARIAVEKAHRAELASRFLNQKVPRADAERCLTAPFPERFARGGALPPLRYVT